MMPRCLAVALVAASLSASASLAQQASARPSAQDQAVLQQACTSDYMQFCGNLDPASPAVDACFERNMQKLSPQCGQAIQSYKQRAKTN